jgi:hypothetical protein
LRSFTAIGAGAREVRPSPKVGNAARMFKTSNALVIGRSRPGVAVTWRSGRVLGLVVVGGLAGAVGERTALSLARLQQRRIESPTPLGPDDRDDREVALDNPQLSIDVYWLGRRFEPGGGLPPLTLSDTVGPLAPGSGPGNVVKIDYSAGDAVIGVTLDLWKPAAWRRFMKTQLGRLVWSWPCTQTRRMRLRRAEAVIYSGYATKQDGPCPQRMFDRFLAHIHIDDVVVAVNMPYCLTCAARGAPRSRDPYNSIEGMKAITRGLITRHATK